MVNIRLTCRAVKSCNSKTIIIDKCVGSKIVFALSVQKTRAEESSFNSKLTKTILAKSHRISIS